MARVFTTSFLNSGKTYTAVICKTDGALSIFVPDESLHTILPHGRFSFNVQQGLKISTAKLTPAENLVLTILSTIELQHAPAANLEQE